MVVGFMLVALGIWRWLNSIVSAVAPYGKERMIDAILERGSNAATRSSTIGGGTGLSTMLRGLKKIHDSNLTAVVTVSDDGGSSGRLQKELGVLPPGDIRNCLVALADDEALVTDLFRYRFTEGEGLSGHSFGNLFLAAMTGITGNFDQAIKVSSRVLNIKGRVLPATLAVAQLVRKLSRRHAGRGRVEHLRSRAPIADVFLDPPHAAPLEEVIEAIRDADAIVLGPGSLYTSIMPNLLVDRVAREIEAASAVKIYVCNVMTQPGETDAASPPRARQARCSRRQRARLRCRDRQRRAAAQTARSLRRGRSAAGRSVDTAAIEKLGVRVVRAAVISETQNVRHDSEKLAPSSSASSTKPSRPRVVREIPLHTAGAALGDVAYSRAALLRAKRAAAARTQLGARAHRLR
jgi:uncharacterized cofD-like protein